MRNRTKSIRRFLAAWGLLFVAGVALFITAFFFGHHNIRLSRSYFLEKDIRNLHYLETHVPIDYAGAVKDYESLLNRIRFDNRVEDYTDRYEQALARTREKVRMIELVRAYESTGEEQRLAEAYAVFSSDEYRRLEVYYFTSLWYQGEMLSKIWFQNRLGEADTEREGEPGAKEPAVGSAPQTSIERSYETRSSLPDARDFLATLFLWFLVSLVSVTVWFGTRKLLGG